MRSNSMALAPEMNRDLHRMATCRQIEEGSMNLTTRNLLFLFGIALGLRLLNLLVIDDLGAYAMVPDSHFYWSGALAWIESGFFSHFDGTNYVPITERTPLYFLFLTPFRWVFGDLVGPVVVAQAVLDAGTCMVIAMLGGMLDRTTGILAGLFAAFWPNMIIHSALILTDSLFLFFIALGLLFVARFLHCGRPSEIYLASFVCGLAIMTRPVGMLLPLGILVVTPIVLHRHGNDWRKSGGAALIAMLIVALPVSPLLARNISQFGTVQLTSQSGTHFLGWVVGYSRALDRGESFDTASEQVSRKWMSEKTIRSNERPPNAFEESRKRMSLAREELSRIPFTSLLKAWSSGGALNLVAPVTAIDPRIRSLNRKSYYNSLGTSLIDRSLNFMANNDVVYIRWLLLGLVIGTIALILQMAGWVILLRCNFWSAILGLLFISYFLLINGPVGGPKYRLPMEPVFIILQSIALLGLWKRWNRG